MEGLLFGLTGVHLYGVYHASDPASDRGEGIVLCNPFGQEYMRAHRSLRRLADALSDLGYHVLRFDYRGTGDSAGDMTGVLPRDWLQDIELAIQELRDISATRKTSLVGLRLGALLAAEAARASDLRRLVLWDPPRSGQAYLDELTEAIEQSADEAGDFIDTSGELHFNGFSIHPEFQAGLAEMSLLSTLREFPGRVLQIVAHEDSAQSELRDHYSDLPGFEYRLTPAPHDWNYVDHVGGIMFPQPILHAIAAWFG